jgi:tRNA-guanine family transglycosylase
MSAHPFTFYPSLSSDPSSWPWRNRVQLDGALISLDVLAKVPEALRDRGNDVKSALGFSGFVILDNGAYGTHTVLDPLLVNSAQSAQRPNLQIVLDVPSSRLTLSLTQKRAVRSTIRNARRVVKANRGTAKLMAVVQGNTSDQIASCAVALEGLGFRHLGIPLSSMSKRRAYADAVTKVQIVRNALPKSTQLHALGCGSRTMMALMATLGVTSCDSSSYYKVAARGKLFEHESMCSIGEPYSRPECAQCLKRYRPPSSFRGRSTYNIRQILKEVQRCRCAAERGVLPKYLATIRLRTTAQRKVLQLLA